MKKMEKTWIINSLECIVNFNSNENVINKINWCYSIVDDGYLVDENGSTILMFSENDSFIPINEITKDQLIEWICEHNDLVVLENNLILRLEELKNPQLITLKPNF
jgi:hypothetical protein